MDMEMDKRQDRCPCGSKLFYMEFHEDNRYVCCAGLNCNKKWLAKRQEDKMLPTFKELKNEFNG